MLEPGSRTRSTPCSTRYTARPPAGLVTSSARADGWLAGLELTVDESETVARPPCARSTSSARRSHCWTGRSHNRHWQWPEIRAADEHPRPRRLDRRGGDGRDRRHPRFSSPRASWSAISGWTQGPPVRLEPARLRAHLKARGPAQARHDAWPKPRGGDAQPRADARLWRAHPSSSRLSGRVTALARKLAVLCWHLLTREEDYAYARPTLLTTEARRLRPRRWASSHPHCEHKRRHPRARKRALAEQAESAYRRLVADWKAAKGAGATPGRASKRPSKGKAARQATSP